MGSITRRVGLGVGKTGFLAYECLVELSAQCQKEYLVWVTPVNVSVSVFNIVSTVKMNEISLSSTFRVQYNGIKTI